MASGEAEPLQYTTTVLRVSIHCEGCKKKVKKVLHSIEGVYKVTVDAAQHKVKVTGSLGADALIRRLHKAGKQAALWPPAAAPPAAAEAKKPQEVVVEAAPALPVPGESSAKEEPKPPKEAAASPAAKDKAPPPGPEAESKEKKPAKEKKADKAEAAKPNKDVEAVAEAKEEKKKGSSPLPAAEAGAEEPSSGKKGGKNNNKKSKAKDGGEGEEAPSPTPAPAVEKPSSTMPAPAPVLGVAERPHGGAFPYYAAGQPVAMSYNVAHPSSSVSYYAPTTAAALPMHPMPPQAPAMMPYGYPPPPGYSGMVPVPELLYGPPGMRSSYPSPPQESYNNMFNEENANSCSLM